MDIKYKMYEWIKDLFPICRSITGKGVRETLYYFKKQVPNLKIKSIKSGSKVFDWKVPDEWIIKDAYIKDQKGKKIVDFKKNNLHVVGYSKYIKGWIKYKDLLKKLYYLKGQPKAIPYITTYYKRDWGFCLPYNIKKKLKKKKHFVLIDSKFIKGKLNYGEIYIKGKSKKEIFLSTYICHPSMANNELSGPVVTIGLAKWLKSLKNRKYSYRIVLAPETIGSLVYLKRNLKKLKKNVIAAFNINCVGDNRTFSFLPSRNGNTLADNAAIYALKNIYPNFKKYSFMDRGSDERQYCSPNVDLPMVSIMRSKYGTYPEYHTSLDNLGVVSPEGLEGAFKAISEAIKFIEINKKYKSNFVGEPFLSKRNMYPSKGMSIIGKSKKNLDQNIFNILNFIAYSDGKNDLISISEKMNLPVIKVSKIAEKLIKKKLIHVVN